MRRKWIPIGLMLGLLAAAITGGAVLAGGPDEDDGDDDATEVVVTEDRVTTVSVGNADVDAVGEEPDELAARIAEILGADPQTTADAMAQVDAAAYAEYVENLLTEAVEDGLITAEQANDIRAQVQSGDHTALDGALGVQL